MGKAAKKHRWPEKDPRAPQKESELTQQILDMLNCLPGVFAYKHYSGGPFGLSGVHDIICCLRGKFVSIEVKNPKIKPKYSRKQAEFAKKIEKAKGISICVNSLEQVAEKLNLNVRLFPLFNKSKHLTGLTNADKEAVQGSA
ncbi:MAG: hypothetical protein JRJ29_11610 [Deltaproteobacteria bacterium]|nr:hypothetical protein [Deltaproteobacteria bacterium]